MYLYTEKGFGAKNEPGDRSNCPPCTEIGQSMSIRTVGCFGMEILEIPEIVMSALRLRNFNMRLRFSSMDQIRKLQGVLDKEDYQRVSTYSIFLSQMLTLSASHTIY